MQLLFERLTRPAARVPMAASTSLANLQSAVVAELARIFSTRSYFGETEGPWPDLLNFGIPRSVDFSEARSADLDVLRAEIEKAVRRFEPRLKEPVVQLYRDARTADSARVTIAGWVELGGETAQVIFPIPAAMIAA